MDPSWGTKAAMEGISTFYKWMLETSKGALDTRSLGMQVHEFDWSKINNVTYDENGVVIRTIPAIHLEGSVSFILEWQGMKIAFSGDTLVQKILEGCQNQGALIDTIYLKDLEISPCKAHKTQDGKGCVLHDGMDQIYKVFEDADGLAFP